MYNHYKPIQKMKKLLLILAAAVAFSACGGTKKEENKEACGEAKECCKDSVCTDNKMRAYVAEDGARFEIVEENAEAETLKVLNVNTKEVYDMKRVESADGEKYQDAAGHIFWLKGEEFYFFVTDEKGEENIVATGKLQKCCKEDAACAEKKDCCKGENK